MEDSACLKCSPSDGLWLGALPPSCSLQPGVKAARFLCDSEALASPCGVAAGIHGLLWPGGVSSKVAKVAGQVLHPGETGRATVLFVSLLGSCVPVRLTLLGAREACGKRDPASPLLLTAPGQRCRHPVLGFPCRLPPPSSQVPAAPSGQGGSLTCSRGCVQLPRAPAWHHGTVARGLGQHSAPSEPFSSVAIDRAPTLAGGAPEGAVQAAGGRAGEAPPAAQHRAGECERVSARAPPRPAPPRLRSSPNPSPAGEADRLLRAGDTAGPLPGGEDHREPGGAVQCLHHAAGLRGVQHAAGEPGGAWAGPVLTISSEAHMNFGYEQPELLLWGFLSRGP